MATTVEDLLTGPLAASLSGRVVPDSPRAIRQITLLEELTSTDALRPGALAVLSRASTVPASGYRQAGRRAGGLGHRPAPQHPPLAHC